MDEKSEITKDKNNSNTIKLEKKYEEQLEKLNIFNLIKSENLIDKKEALELLMKFFNNFDSLLDKYEAVIKILNKIFPILLNINIGSTPISNEIDIKNIDLYINIGKYLLQFLFNEEYILDFSLFENSGNLEKKFPCIFLYNKSEIINISELDNKRYRLLQYNVLKKFKNEIFDLYIKYFIQQMLILDTNFEIQYIMFEMLKYLYFLCKENASKDVLLKYISEILINLSLFNKQSEYEKSKSSREFGFYLLIHEKNFKFIDNSLIVSPNNEYDVYTTKFNMATDLMNKALYIKKEIPQGKILEIFEDMKAKYSILYLEFFVEDNEEISLTIFKKNEKDNNYEQIGFNNIIKTVKFDENDEKENIYKIAKVIVLNSGNSLDNENNMNYFNTFKIVFDNYDSWFTNRILHYSISIFEKIEE